MTTTQKTFNDCRANRNYCFGQYEQICEDVVKTHLGEDREFKGGSMTWNDFDGRSYGNGDKVEVHIDFILHVITIKKTIY